MGSLLIPSTCESETLVFSSVLISIVSLFLGDSETRVALEQVLYFSVVPIWLQPSVVDNRGVVCPFKVPVHVRCLIININRHSPPE